MELKVTNVVGLAFSIAILFSASSLSAIATPKSETLPADVLEKYRLEIGALNSEQEAPAELRFQIMLSVLEQRPKDPEEAPSAAIRRLAEHDLNFMRSTLQNKWKDTSKSSKYLLNVDRFVASHPIPETMTFKEHAYLFFCLSAIISGVDNENLEDAYRAKIHTMVSITVHPLGEWSIKSELENQTYAKFIFHVSGNGLASVRLMNNMTACRANASQQYIAVRLIAVPCDEEVGFDGVKNTGSLKVLIHDLIHCGFLKRAFMDDPEGYHALLQKLGRIWDAVLVDEALLLNLILEAQVQAAWFMWSHELTTSPFVDGWPRQLPKAKWYYGGVYTSRPQSLLRLAAKIGYIPELFRNEIKTEQGLLQHVGLEVRGDKNGAANEHEQVKEIMQLLSPGYEYLRSRFESEYGHRSRWSVMLTRLNDVWAWFMTSESERD